MKKITFFAVVLMISFFGINNTKAQVSLNINIGSQPAWGPTGYDHVDYYYFPDIDAYYDVPAQQYVYLNAGRWIRVNTLPARFVHFDLYRSYKVVINEPRPWIRNSVYVARYAKFKNYGGRQPVIRDSRDSKYFVVKGHPNYNNHTTVIVNNNNRIDRSHRTVIRTNERPSRNTAPGNHNNRGEQGHERNHRDGRRG